MVKYNFPEYEVDLEIPDDVYFPSDDTFFLLNSIKLNRNHNILVEIGGGSGIISIVLARRYDHLRTIITDISFKATKTIENNCRTNNLQDRVDTICMDKLLALRYFTPDIVIWNPPYLPKEREEEHLQSIEKKMIVGGKEGYEEVIELIKQIRSREIKTEFITIFSSLTLNKLKLEQLFEDNFDMEILSETKLFFEKLYLVKLKL
ncbi:MAG: methyltransferase [Candidatus Heimdallarchaeaceae archaeon]